MNKFIYVFNKCSLSTSSEQGMSQALEWQQGAPYMLPVTVYPMKVQFVTSPT